MDNFIVFTPFWKKKLQIKKMVIKNTSRAPVLSFKKKKKKPKTRFLQN